MQHSAKIASSVMFVSGLERSVAFYRDVFACEVTVRDSQSALLLAPGGLQIYLKEVGASTQHSVGGIGVQYFAWATHSEASLRHFEQILRDRGCYIDTHSRQGISFVEGRDPDGVRVIISHPSPEQLPRKSMDPRLYGW